MADDVPVSDIEAHLGYWLRTVSNAVSQSFARSVEAEGVTVAEWVFLRMLYDVESIAPSQLAERMGMTKGAISKLADRLVEKDLVVRQAQANSKRGQTLMLKPVARQLVTRLAALADQNDAAFFGALGQEERNQLERMLRRIARERHLGDIPIA